MKKSQKSDYSICEPHRNHRWKVRSVAGDTNEEAFMYAEKIRIPDFDTQAKDRILIITLYDCVLSKTDVMQEILHLVGKTGDTIIERLDGEGRSNSQFIFYNSHVSKIKMPQLDYTSSEISRVEVTVSYDSSWYKRVI